MPGVILHVRDRRGQALGAEVSRVVPVLASAERCEVHGVSWYAQSDDPWYASQGRTLEQCIRRFEDGLLATAALHVEKHGGWPSDPCPADMAIGDPSVVAGAVMLEEHALNAVGLPHTTLAFWADRSREDDPQPCRCVPLDKFLGVLRENGVKVTKEGCGQT